MTRSPGSTATRSAPVARTQDVLAAKGILGRGTGRRVVFAQDSVFGQGNVAAVRAILGGAGHSVSSVLVPLSAQDFRRSRSARSQMNPDLLFVAWAGTTAPAMWRASSSGDDPRHDRRDGPRRAGDVGELRPRPELHPHPSPEAPKNKVNTWLKPDEADEPGAGHLHAGRVRDRADDPARRLPRGRRRPDDQRARGLSSSGRRRARSGSASPTTRCSSRCSRCRTPGEQQVGAQFR